MTARHLPYVLPVERVRDGIDLTWAVTIGGTTFLWPGIDTPTWWRNSAMDDEFRRMERHGYSLFLHPGNNTVLVEQEPRGDQ